MPTSEACRDGSAASHVAIGLRALAAAAGSAKAVLFGLNLTGDSPVNTIGVRGVGLTGASAGTGTSFTASSV